jgi:alkylated DNA repair dioxygenase AlkB
MDQLDLFGKKISNTAPVMHRKVMLENGAYLFIPHFFSAKESDMYLQSLLKTIDWKQEGMNMYGKYVPFPRLTAWYGNNDKDYSFSGITLNPKPWTEELLAIKTAIEAPAETVFNSVLLNLYRDGSDSISWHQDNEKELGINPIIASVNFGATRTFQMRHKKTREQIDIPLSHGSLLVMFGETQHHWQHQVPKTKQKVGERINLTFRTIK